MCENFEEVFEIINQFSNKLEKKEQIDAKTNIFYILGVQDLEVRHSNFLAWLMENHKKFLSLFLMKVCKYNINESEKLANSYCEVYREYYSNDRRILQPTVINEQIDNNRHSIDLVINFKNDKILIVIENKLYSTESENQLSKYYNDIERNEEFNGYTKYYIYLTLNGEQPKIEEDKKHWNVLSYKTILEILKKIKPTNKNLEVGDLLVNHYIDVLQDKTERVMDRKKIYWQKYKNDANFRQVINEIMDIVPQYDERLRKLRYSCGNITQYHVSISENCTPSFPQVLISELTEILIQKNLDANFIYVNLRNSIGSGNFILEISVNINDVNSRVFYDNMSKMLNVGKQSSELKNGYHNIYTYNFKIDETQNEDVKQDLICEKFVKFLYF